MSSKKKKNLITCELNLRQSIVTGSRNRWGKTSIDSST